MLIARGKTAAIPYIIVSLKKRFKELNKFELEYTNIIIRKCNPQKIIVLLLLMYKMINR